MSSSDIPATILTVRSPADLVCVVPYLIGFHSDDGSLVVTAFANGQVVFAARSDLPGAGAPASEVRGLAEHLIPVVRHQPTVTDVALIGYGSANHVDPMLHIVAQAFTTAGILVRDLLRVSDAQVFSITCDNPVCCPPQGTRFDPAASPVAVQATVAGLVALPDRAAVAARFAPVDDATAKRMRQATHRATNRLRSLLDEGHTGIFQAGAHALEAALHHHDTGQPLTDDQVAWLTVLLTRTSVRDLAVELTQPHDGHVTFWADITRRAARPFAAAPATLLALTAWCSGNGALAAMAAEHAPQVKPGYQLAGLLLQALHAGLPPATFEQPPAGAVNRTVDRAATTPHRPETGTTGPA